MGLRSEQGTERICGSAGVGGKRLAAGLLAGGRCSRKQVPLYVCKAQPVTPPGGPGGCVAGLPTA
jgi:hypothetical protein